MSKVGVARGSTPELKYGKGGDRVFLNRGTSTHTPTWVQGLSVVHRGTQSVSGTHGVQRSEQAEPLVDLKVKRRASPFPSHSRAVKGKGFALGSSV